MTRPGYDVREFFRNDIRHDDPEHVTAWRDWFARHGIDPAEVLLTEWVERRVNPGQNQIVWLEQGVRDGQSITVHREMDLTEPPAPFPVP